MEFIRVAYYLDGQPGPIVHTVTAQTVEEAISASDETVSDLAGLPVPLVRLEILEPKHHRAVAAWSRSGWSVF
ncbi:hypothetical protein SPF06_05825 [Sinomonas sp. JGH33]|uniref:Uncharacterized protein n=1 Tax=Sinomonas terricola TaxID=3110330 RepID=A0ABU5T3K4_9MICC|nr:hypothetical protein [Sinomonas sp. JGH33]MEA5454239.1 hypothetical protein [Sinomonas sp. JGH33]